MADSRVDLFIRKLRFSNTPKLYKMSARVEKFAERKTNELCFRLQANGVDMSKFIEYSLFNLDHGWRYNVIMDALKSNCITAKEIKYITPIDEFVAGMMHEHEFAHEKLSGIKKVFEYDKLNVDKYVRSVLVVAAEAEMEELKESADDNEKDVVVKATEDDTADMM